MKQAQLDKLKSLASAKKRVEQARYASLKRSQDEVREDAEILKTAARKTVMPVHQNCSASELLNCASHMHNQYSLAAEKNMAADYLNDMVAGRRADLERSFQKELTLEQMLNDASKAERQRLNAQEEQHLEVVRFAKVLTND